MLPGDSLKAFCSIGSVLDSIGPVELLNGEIRNAYYFNNGSRWIEGD
jgi:hypothetical protein